MLFGSSAMHENLAKETVAQVPEISRPDPLHVSPIHELAKHRIETVAPLSDAETALWSGSVESMTKRGQQGNAAFGEVCA